MKLTDLGYWYCTYYHDFSDNMYCEYSKKMPTDAHIAKLRKNNSFYCAQVHYQNQSLTADELLHCDLPPSLKELHFTNITADTGRGNDILYILDHIRHIRHISNLGITDTIKSGLVQYYFQMNLDQLQNHILDLYEKAAYHIKRYIANDLIGELRLELPSAPWLPLSFNSEGKLIIK